MTWEVKTSTPTKACPHCGAQIAAQAVMCPHCKTDLGLIKKKNWLEGFIIKSGRDLWNWYLSKKLWLKIAIPVAILFSFGILVFIAQPNIETTEQTEIQEIPFETTYQDDQNLIKGETKIKVEGSNGKKELIYKITFRDGKEERRETISETVTVQPINKVVLTGVAQSTTTAAPQPKPKGPAENVQASAKNVLKDRLIGTEFNVENGIAKVTFRGDYDYYQKKQVSEAVVETAKRIYGDEGAVQKIYFSVTGGDKYQDAYGNKAHEPEIALIFLFKPTAEKINLDNFNWENLPIVADYYKEYVELN